DWKAGAGPGAPPEKAAPSSQRLRLRQRHRLTLEEGKLGVERCLEALVSGDIEDDEIGRLRPLRGPRVQGYEDSGDSEAENEAKDNFAPQKKPVWVDEEDEDEEMIMMKNASEKFQHAVGGVPAWAETNRRKTSSDDESEEHEDALLQRTGNFISTITSLPRGILKMRNCQRSSSERPTAAQISSVQFHPCAQIVIVVDGRTNPKIQSTYLERFQILKACLSANGEEVLATSTHSKVFYVYDMLAGKLIPVHPKMVRSSEVSPDGSFLLINGTARYLHLLSMKTKELIGSMKINGRVAASTFSSDSKKVYASSEDGEVYVWDVNSRRCLNRFYVACGSNCGVVNINSQDSCLRETNPKPIKAIMNLVTGVTSLTFNPTTEILAVASEKNERSSQIGSSSFLYSISNFPVIKKKNISHVYTMEFSLRGGYFALGNEKGKALMYRLHHYSDF
uniref:U3 small nucleolar RNA-associated protein 18 homolog n=1 Tax=Macaca nemestrina TaxID=9545 RepID=A0A2K6DS10_MACNE